jgi:complement component 1 Q subcomponent-binding protein
LSCQDGQFTVENISFYDDAKVGTDLTAESDWKRRGLYIGPTFDTLDVGLQDEFEKYLQERGINETVASFIPEYSAYKEQQVGFQTNKRCLPYSHFAGICQVVGQGQDIC